jgi:hypothetical protein
MTGMRQMENRTGHIIVAIKEIRKWFTVNTKA